MVPTGSDLCAAAASLIRVKRARAKRRRSRGGLTFILSDGTGRPRGECVPEGRACAHKYKASTHLCLVFFLRTKHLGLEKPLRRARALRRRAQIQIWNPPFASRSSPSPRTRQGAGATPWCAFRVPPAAQTSTKGEPGVSKEPRAKLGRGQLSPRMLIKLFL